MNVTIRKPAKNAMQSGRANPAGWVLTLDEETARVPEALMGWTSSADTNNQVRLTFPTKEEAIGYAVEKGWAYTVLDAQARRLQPRNYADNFRYTPPDDNDTDVRKTVRDTKRPKS